MERPGIANAGGAAVTDHVESELIEIFLEAGFLEIIGDNAGARRERSLHGRINRQAALDRFLREQTGGEHHAWVARVRAARDGRDQNAAMTDATLPARESVARFRFDFLDRIRRGPVRHHFDFVALITWLDSLIIVVA